MKTANWEQLTATLIQANLYQALKVPKPVFEKSMQCYLMDPAKRTVYEDEMQKLKDEMRVRKLQELTREQVIESVKHLENSKLEAQKKMYEIVRSQRIAPNMINAIIKVEKMRADDKFFNETGIEEEDVEPSLLRLKMEEDEEYKKIVEDFAKQS
jgi:tRNA U34 5-carboxymethylaminomethyl modifying enzyme MnmG/GidA